MTLWTERENAEAAQSTTKMNGFEAQERVGHRQEHRARGKSRSLPLDATRPAEDNHGPESGEGMGQYSSPETASRIYEEAASLLAHNRAVLGQALARSGHMDLGIKHLEIACPEILEYQQNAQGHRNSKSKPTSIGPHSQSCFRALVDIDVLARGAMIPVLGFGIVALDVQMWKELFCWSMCDSRKPLLSSFTVAHADRAA